MNVNTSWKSLEEQFTEFYTKYFDAHVLSTILNGSKEIIHTPRRPWKKSLYEEFANNLCVEELSPPEWDNYAKENRAAIKMWDMKAYTHDDMMDVLCFNSYSMRKSHHNTRRKKKLIRILIALWSLLALFWIVYCIHKYQESKCVREDEYWYHYLCN